MNILFVKLKKKKQQKYTIRNMLMHQNGKVLEDQCQNQNSVAAQMLNKFSIK